MMPKYKCYHRNQLSRGTYVKITSLLFLKAYNTTLSIRIRATQIVAENLTNSIKSGKCRHLIRKPYCTPFASVAPTLIKMQFDQIVIFQNISYLSVVSSKRFKCVSSHRKSAGLFYSCEVRCDQTYVAVVTKILNFHFLIAT